jgi:hypothetical protein
MRRAAIWIAIILFATPVAASPSLDPDDGAVLAPESATDALNQCSRSTPGPANGTWQPTKKQIAALESGLPAALKDAREKRGDHQKLSLTFLRQYAGIIVGGRKIIYVNAFPRGVLDDEHSSKLSWRFQAVMVCDGGPAFFGAVYDPAADRFSDFAFNGPY